MFNECIELKEELHRRLVAVGIDTRPSWNWNWLDKVNSMPEGFDKEVKIDEAIKMILKSVENIGAGKYKIVEKIGDGTPTIEAFVDDILAANADKVTEYRNGNERLFDFFVAIAMKAGKGKVDPAALNDMLKLKLIG